MQALGILLHNVLFYLLAQMKTSRIRRNIFSAVVSIIGLIQRYSKRYSLYWMCPYQSKPDDTLDHASAALLPYSSHCRVG